MSWGEFNIYVNGWSKNREDDWRHTREVLAAIGTNAISQMAQRAGKKSYQIIKGKDIIPLPGDVKDRPLLNQTQELNRFKESCKLLGIPLKPLNIRN